MAGGLFFAAMGLLIFAMLLGQVPGGSKAGNAPTALLWLAGTVFFSAGLGMMLYRFLPRPAAFCALISLCSFVAIFNWIAFGPGERNFTKSTSTSTGAVTATKKNAASEIEGRIVFGLVAGLLDALILFGIYQSVRARKRGTPPGSATGRSATRGKNDA